MIDRVSLSEERQTLAAELALGLLERVERLEAERLRFEHAHFADEVERWEAHAAGWVADLPPTEAPASSWTRVEAALGRQQLGEPMAPAPAQSSDPGQGWQFAAMAASLAAVLFAGLWLTQSGDTDPADEGLLRAEAPRFPTETLSVAQISGKDGADWLVSAAYDEAEGTLYLRLNAIEGGDRVPELWVIGPAGVPRSLGFAEESGSQVIVLTPELQQQMIAGSTLAVSLEEPAAQPSDAPAGPILGTAVLAPLVADAGPTGAAAGGATG